MDVEDLEGVARTVKLESVQKSNNKILRCIDAYGLSYLNTFISVALIGDRTHYLTPAELVLAQNIFRVQKRG